jgi:hypothetical protein
MFIYNRELKKREAKQQAIIDKENRRRNNQVRFTAWYAANASDFNWVVDFLKKNQFRITGRIIIELLRNDEKHPRRIPNNWEKAVNDYVKSLKDTYRLEER